MYVNSKVSESALEFLSIYILPWPRDTEQMMLRKC